MLNMTFNSIFVFIQGAIQVGGRRRKKGLSHKGYGLKGIADCRPEIIIGGPRPTGLVGKVSDNTAMGASGVPPHEFDFLSCSLLVSCHAFLWDWGTEVGLAEFLACPLTVTVGAS